MSLLTEDAKKKKKDPLEGLGFYPAEVNDKGGFKPKDEEEKENQGNWRVCLKVPKEFIGREDIFINLVEKRTGARFQKGLNEIMLSEEVSGGGLESVRFPDQKTALNKVGELNRKMRPPLVIPQNPAPK